MSFWNIPANYVKQNYISWIEKYYSRPVLQPGLAQLQNVKRILVIKHHDQISDFLMATPVFRALRTRYTDAHIGVITHENFAALAQHNPHVNEVIVAQQRGENFSLPKLIKICLRIRNQWDLAVVLNTTSHSLTSDLFAHYSGAKYILGSDHRVFPGATRNFFYNLAAPIWEEHLHHAQRNLDILRHIGIEHNDLREEISVPDKKRRQARDVLIEQGFKPEKPLVGVHVGSATLFGTWPIGRLAELTRNLRTKYGAQIALFWGEKENDRADQFMNYVQYQPFRIEPQKLENLAAFMSLCDVMVFNDNWAMHLAAAVNTPFISIFGPTNPDEYKPVGDKFMAIRGEREKADAITVPMVSAALCKLLPEKFPCDEQELAAELSAREPATSVQKIITGATNANMQEHPAQPETESNHSAANVNGSHKNTEKTAPDDQNTVETSRSENLVEMATASEDSENSKEDETGVDFDIAEDLPEEIEEEKPLNWQIETAEIRFK